MSICEHGKPHIHLFEFPSNLRMLADSIRCNHTQNYTWPTFIPVTHCKHNENVMDPSDDADSTFYYYAQGCSKIFIKTARILEGFNRIDVHLKLLETLFGFGYMDEVTAMTKVKTVCGLDYQHALTLRRSMNPCEKNTNVNDKCLRSMSLHLMNHSLSRRNLARMCNFDTLIYKYEGSDSNVLSHGRWKTEIQRVVPYTKDNFWIGHHNQLSKYVIQGRCLF